MEALTWCVETWNNAWFVFVMILFAWAAINFVGWTVYRIGQFMVVLGELFPGFACGGLFGVALGLFISLSMGKSHWLMLAGGALFAIVGAIAMKEPS